MKVTFVIEYFPPFAPGGGEWSTYSLAKNLSKKGVQVVVITPNLGSKSQEYIGKVKIRRFPFYLKPKDKNKLPGNFAYTNPLWLIWSTFFYIKYLKEENPDVVHIQGSYSIPPGVISSLFLKKPTIATIRDYQIVCNYGMCLLKKDKACNLRDYFFGDFKSYYKEYVINKSISTLITNLVFATWGRISKNYLKFFSNRVDYLICVSNRQREIIAKNSVNKPIKVIYNSFDFGERRLERSKKKNILYVGRFTYGKGVRLLWGAIPKVSRKIKGLKFMFIGQGYLRDELEKFAKNYKNISILGQLSHDSVYDYYRQSLLVVVPSIWPEPFGRVAVEAISQNTPVIATDSGGLPEIVKNEKYGYISQKSPDDLARKIIKGIKNNMHFRKNIQKDFSQLKTLFTTQVANEYIDLYKKLRK